MSESKPTVYLLTCWADDYHGGFQIVGVYATEEAAAQAIPPDTRCCPDNPDCSEHFSFSVQAEEVRS